MKLFRLWKVHFLLNAINTLIFISFQVSADMTSSEINFAHEFLGINSSLPLANVTHIKTSKVTTINGGPPRKVELLPKQPIPSIAPTSSAPKPVSKDPDQLELPKVQSLVSNSNSTPVWSQPLVMNMNEGRNKISFAEFKNHTLLSNKEISSKTHEEIILPAGNDNQPDHSNNNNSNNNNRVIENNPAGNCGQNVPNPTLTPNLHPKPRFATIQWRRVIFPPGYPGSLDTLAYPSLFNPDYKPFYYQKMVKYSPNRPPVVSVQAPQGFQHPMSPGLPSTMNPYMPLVPPPPPVARYPQSGKRKGNRMPFQAIFSRLKRGKTRRRPFNFPYPMGIHPQLSHFPMISDGEMNTANISPQSSMLHVRHQSHSEPLIKKELLEFKPNPRRNQEVPKRRRKKLRKKKNGSSNRRKNVNKVDPKILPAKERNETDI